MMQCKANYKISDIRLFIPRE